MRAIFLAAFATALLIPASRAPAGDAPMVLALNPQPEPPGKAKIKSIYSGKDDSKKQKLKQKQLPNTGGPTSTY